MEKLICINNKGFERQLEQGAEYNLLDKKICSCGCNRELFDIGIRTQINTIRYGSRTKLRSSKVFWFCSDRFKVALNQGAAVSHSVDALPRLNCSNCAHFRLGSDKFIHTRDEHGIVIHTSVEECANLAHPITDCISKGFSCHSDK